MANRCAQMVGAMLSRDPSDLPQRLLNALGERFKAFAKAHTHRFDIGVREHEVVQQMGKGLPSNRHVEIIHGGEIRLGAFRGHMHLFKDDFPLGSLLRTPLGNLALQGTHLSRTILAWVALAQLGEQGCPL
jgi:hypothetical protein